MTTEQPITAEALKPCPFCGGKAELDDSARDHWIACRNCGASPRLEPLACDVSKASAIKIWNRRADSAGISRLKAEVERLTLEADPEALTIAHMYGASSARDEVAELRSQVDELKSEAEVLDEARADQNRMVDRIADLIGLPQDQELDTTAFELWISDIHSRVETLERENAALAAGACPVSGGLLGDEYGNMVCQLKAEIKRLREFESHMISEGMQGASRYWEERWRTAEAENAQLKGDVERLREALTEITEGVNRTVGEPYRRDGVVSKNDKCRHGACMWEPCEECIGDFARSVLGEQS